MKDPPTTDHQEIESLDELACGLERVLAPRRYATAELKRSVGARLGRRTASAVLVCSLLLASYYVGRPEIEPGAPGAIPTPLVERAPRPAPTEAPRRADEPTRTHPTRPPETPEDVIDGAGLAGVGGAGAIEVVPLSTGDSAAEAGSR